VNSLAVRTSAIERFCDRSVRRIASLSVPHLEGAKCRKPVVLRGRKTYRPGRTLRSSHLSGDQAQPAVQAFPSFSLPLVGKHLIWLRSLPAVASTEVVCEFGVDVRGVVR
jgi:hypothetical protein